jgi:protein arginine kinase
MKFLDLTNKTGEWLRGGGPLQDVVISSRVRLARNLAGMPFLPRCSDEQRADLERRLRGEILEANLAPEMFYVDVAGAGELDRQLLVERHLVSRQHAAGVEGAVDKKSPPKPTAHPRGVAVSGDETLAIMVNEEDHLRIQVLRSALQLPQAVAEIHRVHELLEQRLDFAFHPRYGYLTACPTNVGTGLRVSVMLHLPALKMTGEIEKAFRAARDMRLAIRGLYGEGTEASGDFFQVSNQTTLGKSEQEIVEEFHDQILPELIQYEKRARASLMQRNRASLEDKAHRSLAILRSARTIGSDETMYLLSLVRLGVNLELLAGIELATINELFLLAQSAHLQRTLHAELAPAQRGVARADMLRKRLA